MMNNKDAQEYHKMIEKLQKKEDKRKKTESEKMQEELEPIGILKRGRTSWAMDVNFRFPRGKQRDEKKK